MLARIHDSKEAFYTIIHIVAVNTFVKLVLVQDILEYAGCQATACWATPNKLTIPVPVSTNISKSIIVFAFSIMNVDHIEIKYIP